MRRKILYPLTGFALVFLSHALYSIWKASQVSQQWAQFESVSVLSLYLEQRLFLLGYSYALAGAFTIHALLRFLQDRRSGVSGLVGGITLAGILSIGGCFLLGCCGSPMLAVYLSLFGASFLGFTRPLTAVVTTLSVIIGYCWIEKKTRSCRVRHDKCASPQ